MSWSRTALGYRLGRARSSKTVPKNVRLDGVVVVD
jgi:hypothetical protein